MRKRTRENTHQVRVYKFRAFVKPDQIDRPGILPGAVYAFAKRQQELWNALATEQERRWTEWKAANPAVDVACRSKFKKPGKEWWAEWEAWMRQRAAASDLGWETEEDIIDRFSATLRRLAKGGGSPKVRHRLNSFSIPHRYSGGGVSLTKLESDRAERFRLKFPPSAVYRNNDRESRRSRVTNALFGIEKEQISLSLVLHREIPADAIVKNVRLCGWKQSPVVNWLCHVAITVEVPTEAEFSPTGRQVGIDVGWRKLDEERMRVAVAYDGRRHTDLILPLKFDKNGIGEVSLERKRGCQQLKDQMVLERCKKELGSLGLFVPTQARNGYLIRLLRDPSIPPVALAVLERWKRDNDTLQRKILLLENCMAGRREHLYREFAAKLAQKYDLIRVEDLDMKEISELESNKEAKLVGEYALWNSRERRKYAACSTLIAAIKNAAGNRFEKMEAAYTTKICSRCGGDFRTGHDKLEGSCLRCGRVIDQDWNAAENIYATSLLPVQQRGLRQIPRDQSV